MNAPRGIQFVCKINMAFKFTKNCYAKFKARRAQCLIINEICSTRQLHIILYLLHAYSYNCTWKRFVFVI